MSSSGLSFDAGVSPATKGAAGRVGVDCRAVPEDIAGRKVLDLQPGPNDVSLLTPGVYFVRSKPQAMWKVILTR